MVINEMRYEFKLRKNKVDSLANLDFTAVEIDSYINRGQLIFVKDRASFKPGRNAFETNSNALTGLQNIHIKSPELQVGLAPVNIGDGIYRVDFSLLTYEYLYLTRGRADIVKNSCTKLKVRIHPEQTDDKTTYLERSNFTFGRVNAYFGKSNSTTAVNVEKSALYLDTNNAFTITTVYLDYIKYPARVFSGGYAHIDGQSSNIDPQIHSDIDSAFHDEIVNLAVLEAQKDAANTQGYQMQAAQVQQDKLN